MYRILIFASLFISGNLIGQSSINLEDLWQNYAYMANRVAGFNFQKDGRHFTKIDERYIKQYDLTTGEFTKNLADVKSALGSRYSDQFSFDGFGFSKNEEKIIIKTESESIYRRSSKGIFFVYTIGDQDSLEPIDGFGTKVSYATFNNNAEKVAFVKENNLYCKDLNSGEITQVTKDGQSNQIINGATDWVYEEEFAFAKAFFWSEDGTKLAYYKFDESQVKEFTMTEYKNGLYPEYVTFKYPKTGEDNSKVSIHIYDVNTQKTVDVKLGDCEYIPRIKWTKDPNQLCVFKMNRHQNELELVLAEAKTGKTHSLLKEKNKYYIDITDDLTFLEDGERFIWTSEKSGYNHVYLHNMKGKELKALTKGNYDVTSFYGVDERNGKIFYQAAKVNPMQREIYSANLKGKKEMKLTKKDGWNNAQFSGTFDYYVNNYSNANEPATFEVFDASNKLVRTIEDNKMLKSKQKSLETQAVEFFSFKTSEEVELNGYMIKPPNFDKSKKYPVFMYVYGGPGSQTVKDSWGGQNYWWFQMMAQKGYLVVSVDNRGTGGRGEEFKKMTYLQLGKYETVDQIEAAKYLAKQEYVDAERIGIFGWSYGGYMTSLCLSKGADVFKTAIAVAPVTNWKWYDTIYTERYMRTPQENESGYEDNSPINYTDLIKGNYLLVHGNSDDNVHFQHSAEMTRALIQNGVHFKNLYYPNKNHGIYGGGARLHLYTEMTDFLLEHL